MGGHQELAVLKLSKSTTVQSVGSEIRLSRGSCGVTLELVTLAGWGIPGMVAVWCGATNILAGFFFVSSEPILPDWD